MSADDTDLEEFIRQQKHKLAKTKEEVAQLSSRSQEPGTGAPGRKKWEKKPPAQAVAPQLRREETPETGGGLALGGHDDRQKKLREERRREYNSLLEKNSTNNPPRLPPREASSEQGLNVGGYDDRRKTLQTQRKSEYEDYQQQKPKGVNKLTPRTPDDGLPLGSYEQKRKKLDQERKKEYNDLLIKKIPDHKPKSRPREEAPPPQREPEFGSNLGDNGDKRKKLEEERKNEYTSMLKNQLQKGTGRGVNSRIGAIRLAGARKSPERRPLAEDNEAGFGNRLEDNQEKRKKLSEDRRREYNDQLSKAPAARRNPLKENIPPKPPTPDDGLIGKMGQYAQDRKTLDSERTKEYNRLKAGYDARTPGKQNNADAEEYAATLPGLQDRVSAQDRMKQQRKRDYNDLLEQRQAQDKGRQSRMRVEDIENENPKPFEDKPGPQADAQEYREFLAYKRAKDQFDQSKKKKVPTATLR